MANVWNKIKSTFLKFRELSYVGVSNLVGTATLSLFWLFLASILEPSEYGQVSYLLSIAYVVSVIAFLGAGQTITVFTAKKVMIQSSIYTVSLLCSIITAIVVFFILGKIEVSIYSIGYVIFGLVTQELLGLKLYKQYSLYLITQRFLTVGLALSLYFLIGIDGIIFGYAIAFLPYSFKLYQGFKSSKLDFSLLKSKISFMMHSYGQDLAKIFSRNMDKLIILPLFGSFVLGNYQLGFQVLVILSVLPSITYQYALPKDSSGSQNKKLKGFTILVSGLLAILVIVLAPIVFPSLFPKFTESIEIIQIMSVAVVPISISLMLNSKFLGIEKSSYVITGSLIFLSAQISGILILGDAFGIKGIAFSTVIGATLEAVYLVVMDRIKK